jgi:hypothetical protein
MKDFAVLWLQIYKLVHIFIRSYHAAAKLNPYFDVVCRGFEVAYIPAETLGEISLLCYRENTGSY